MSQQILSQDEVDALLQGITGESQKLDKEDEPLGGVRNYDIDVVNEHDNLAAVL